MRIANVNTRRRFRIIRFYTIGWILAFEFLSIVRGAGTIEEGSAEFDLGTTLILGFVFGLVFGAVAGVAQVLIEERLYRRISLGKLIAVRLTAATIFIVSMNLVAYPLVMWLRGITVDFREFFLEPGSLPIFFFILCADTFLFSLRQVNLLVGEGNLWKLVRGAFYTPREAERIIMFLDLQSSTTHAERLGHVKYSMLIQDCFDDLGVIAEYGAAVYQYVGDGVILTWPLDDGLRNGNCLAAFFRFRDRLSGRVEYYNTQYGVRPTFTAGLNAGVVTVTEIGKFRKDIAFHGDAINTAARIQGQCKELDRDLLLSGPLAHRLDGSDYLFEPLGGITLRGKKDEVPIFEATAPTNPTASR